MPYGGDPGTGTPDQRRDAVFFALGDTDTSSQLLSDAEVDFLLLNTGDDTLAAASDGARALAANFMRQAKVGQGPSNVDPTKRADHYFALADRLTSQLGLNAGVNAGGISIADKRATQDDTDRVPTAFRVDMNDNPRIAADDDLVDCR